MATQRFVVRIPFEHREVHDPQRLPAGWHETEVVADLQAQRTERIVDDLRLVGAEENQIAIDCAPCAARMPLTAASLRNLRIGDCRPSRPFAFSFTFTYARPFAP